MVNPRISSYKAVDILIIFILALSAFLCILPIINTLAVSLSEKIAADAGKVFLLPVNPTLSSYKVIVADESFFRSFWMSVKRVLLGVSINTIITTLMAFPLSRDKKAFPLRNIFMWVILFTMLFNGGLIPLYMLVSRLGLRNSIWSLILPSAVPVFNVIIMMNFFKKIPKELEYAAYVDGAGELRLLFNIFLPVSVPVMATIILFQAVFHWNSFFDGLIFMDKTDFYPLQTYIQQLVIATRDLTRYKDPEQLRRISELSSRTLNASKIFVSAVPIFLIYPFLQRYFVHGIVLGSVKE